MLADVEQTQAQSAVTSLGNIDTSLIYHILHPVYLPSQSHLHRMISLQPPFSQVNYATHHYLRIDQYNIPINIFTYIVTTNNDNNHQREQESKATAQRMSFGKLPSSVTSSLIPSHDVRIYLGEEYVGQGTYFAGMSPNQIFIQPIGIDPLIQVTYSNHLPFHSQTNEDRSTWFVKDTVKYQVTLEEKLISIKNNHASQRSKVNINDKVVEASGDEPMLYIVAEAIPSSTHEDIKVQLLVPTLSEMIVKNDNITDQEFLQEILQKETRQATINKTRNKTSNISNSTRIYYSQSSGLVFWAIWMKGYSSQTHVSLRFKIIRPME
jgi:hypothetical protein